MGKCRKPAPFGPDKRNRRFESGLLRRAVLQNRRLAGAGRNPRCSLTGLIGMAIVEIATHWLHQTAPRNWLSDPHRVFCSQMCVAVLRHSGVDILSGRDYDTIDPATLMAAMLDDPHFRETPIP